MNDQNYMVKYYKPNNKKTTISQTSKKTDTHQKKKQMKTKDKHMLFVNIIFQNILDITFSSVAAVASTPLDSLALASLPEPFTPSTCGMITFLFRGRCFMAS